MSEFGDGSFTQEVLNMVKCAMVNSDDNAERLRVIKAFHKIADYWLGDIELPANEADR